jgi:hypothetical protein
MGGRTLRPIPPVEQAVRETTMAGCGGARTAATGLATLERDGFLYLSHLDVQTSQLGSQAPVQVLQLGWRAFGEESHDKRRHSTHTYARICEGDMRGAVLLRLEFNQYARGWGSRAPILG